MTVESYLNGGSKTRISVVFRDAISALKNILELTINASFFVFEKLNSQILCDIRSLAGFIDRIRKRLLKTIRKKAQNKSTYNNDN